MTLDGKRDHFEFADFKAAARSTGLKRGLDREIFEQVSSAVAENHRLQGKLPHP